jgi:hypothetical protein
MADFYRKTERGRREVRERSVNLPRAARNLLLILDSSKSLDTWIGMINGASLADGEILFEAGLIELQTGPGPESRPAAFEPTEPANFDGWSAATRPAPLRPDSPARNLGVAAPVAVGLTLPQPVGASAAAKAPMVRSIEQPTAASGNAFMDSTNGSLSSLLPEEVSSFIPLDTSGLPAGSVGLGYTELYDSLNALLRETLGLFRGYRYTLRIERAQNIAELEVVAREFITEVKQVRGESMARMVQRALGLGG